MFLLLTAAFLAVMAPSASYQQAKSQLAPLRFDVVSVKPNKSDQFAHMEGTVTRHTNPATDSTNPATDRRYPMNLSEDLLSLGGNQLLFLCSFSRIFAVAKAPHHGRCEDAEY